MPIPAFIKGELAKENSTFGYQPGFLVSYRAAPQIDLFRYTDDAHAAPVRAFLTRVFQAAITVNADGKDSRGLVIDPSARKACEAACAPDATECQRACLKIPLRIFMANRTPATLLVGKVDTTLIENTPAGGGPVETIGAFDKVTVDDSVPLAFGASKVALGHVITREGKLAVRVFVSAFDSRLVCSYDPEARRVEAVIRTGRGPHALAFDSVQVRRLAPSYTIAYLRGSGAAVETIARLAYTPPGAVTPGAALPLTFSNGGTAAISRAAADRRSFPAGEGGTITFDSDPALNAGGGDVALEDCVARLAREVVFGRVLFFLGRWIRCIGGAADVQHEGSTEKGREKFGGAHERISELSGYEVARHYCAFRASSAYVSFRALARTHM